LLACALALGLGACTSKREGAAAPGAAAPSARAAARPAEAPEVSWPPRKGIEASLAGLAAADEKSRVWAIQALGRQTDAASSEKAVSALIDVLRAGPDAGSEQSRALAVLSLGKHGARAAPAVDALRAALADAKLRDVAIDSLGKIGSAAAAAVPELVVVLGSQEERAATRGLAARALGRISTAETDSVVVPALKAALEDPDRRVRQAAAQAMEESAVRRDEGGAPR
jgi:HEAT repeat protein